MARIKRGIYGPSQSSPSTALSSKSAMGSLAESAVLRANACTSWMSGSPESIGNEDLVLLPGIYLIPGASEFRFGSLDLV